MYTDQVRNHLIPLIAPADTGSTTANSDVFDASECIAVACQVAFGAITGDSVVVTVEECDDTTPSNSTAIAFKYRLSSAVGTDSMGDLTDATAAGATLAASDDDKILEIFVDPRALSAGYPYLRLVVDPGASMTACLISAAASVLPRYNPPGSMVD